MPTLKSANNPSSGYERVPLGATGASSGLPLDRGRSQALADDLVSLIERSVLKSHDAGVGSRAALLERHHLGVGTEGVADEYRFWHYQLVVAEIGDQRTQGGIAYRKTDHQCEGKCAVHQNLAELALLRGLAVDVQRLRVVRHRRKEEIVGLSDGSPDLMGDDIAHPPFVKPSSRHLPSPVRYN